MSSSSNTQGNETTPRKKWYQHLLSARKDYDLQNTSQKRQIFDAIPVMAGIVWVVLGWIVMVFFFGNFIGFGYLTVFLVVLCILLLAAEKILDWFEGRGFGKIIEDQADKVKSKVSPPQPRPAAKKAAAPAEPVTRPMSQRPTPAVNPRQAQARRSGAQQTQARPSAGNARGTQDGRGTRRQARPTPAASQSSQTPGSYRMKPGTVAREKLS